MQWLLADTPCLHAVGIIHVSVLLIERVEDGRERRGRREREGKRKRRERRGGGERERDRMKDVDRILKWH